MKVTVKIDNETYEVEIDNLYARPVHATVDGETFEVYPELSGSQRPVRSMAAPLPSPAVSVAPQASQQVAASDAPAAAPAPVSQGAPVAADAGSSAVNAPIPGVIVSIDVAPGAQVNVGDTLVILEAMKMKNVIRSPRAGEIAHVAVQTGQHVRHNDLLVTFAD